MLVLESQVDKSGRPAVGPASRTGYVRMEWTIATASFQSAVPGAVPSGDLPDHWRSEPRRQLRRTL